MPSCEGSGARMCAKIELYVGRKEKTKFRQNDYKDEN